MRDVLRRLVAGELSEDEALAEIRRMQLAELGGRARLDLGRYLRRGIPEVVLATGKSPEDAARLAVRLAEQHGQGLISRMGGAHRAALAEAVGAHRAALAEAVGAQRAAPAEAAGAQRAALAEAAGAHRAAPAEAAGAMRIVDYHSSARVLRDGHEPERIDARVAILTAGTSDVPVADEARMVVEACGLETRLEADLGVAGLHRFVGPLAEMLEWGADAIIVAAGMDGVLPGLVAGLVDAPVIGLPTSTGYGRGGAGEGALTTMLQSCSTGLTVVNIDNGVGAGAAAVLIAARAAQGRRRGRSTATSANTSAPRSSRPNTIAAIARDTSAPPGKAKTTASNRTAKRIPVSSHGKPRRGRP